MDEALSMPNLAQKREELGDEAYVDFCLEGSYNDFGKSRWWQRARVELNGKSPSEAWDTDKEKVIKLAESLFS